MGSIKGKADMKALKKLERQFKQLEKKKTDVFLRFLTKDLARITLNQFIYRTPVDTGDLRKAWTGGVEMSVSAYIQTKRVSKKGNTYKMTLKNNMKYASYVEYGHRKVNNTGWVDGRFMCQKSVADVKARYPSIARRNLERFLKENIDV